MRGARSWPTPRATFSAIGLQPLPTSSSGNAPCGILGSPGRRAISAPPLVATDSLAPVEQPQEALQALERAVEELDPWRLMGLHAATRLTGSLVLGLAIARGRLGADTAFDLALLEELYEIGIWGLTEMQAQRHAALRAEFTAVGRFFDLL